MIELNKKTLKALRAGELTIEDVASELVKTHPAQEIAESLVDQLMLDVPVPTVTVDEDEYEFIFKKLFRVRGININGNAERRGRPRKGIQPTKD